MAALLLLLCLAAHDGMASNAAAASDPSPNDYQTFLAQHDMIWDRGPPRWELAPFSGNGMVGFLVYQDKDAPRTSSVSASGVTQFLTVKSLIGSPCVVQVDIPKPRTYIDGQPAACRDTPTVSEDETHRRSSRRTFQRSAGILPANE